MNLIIVKFLREPYMMNIQVLLIPAHYSSNFPMFTIAFVDPGTFKIDDLYSRRGIEVVTNVHCLRQPGSVFLATFGGFGDGRGYIATLTTMFLRIAPTDLDALANQCGTEGANDGPSKRDGVVSMKW